MTRRFISLVMVTGMACSSRTEPTAIVERLSSTALIGAWDVEMRLGASYALAPHPPSAQVICGTMGFVHGAEVAGAGQPHPILIGVYDLPLGRLGLNWEESERFPVANGYVRPTHGAKSQWIDSIDVFLNPESSERIKLSGRRVGDAIVGRWSAESARGYASGSFQMWRRDGHDPSIRQPCASR